MTSSRRRRCGQPFLVYRSKTVIDRRGDRVRTVDMDSRPYEVTGVFAPQRSSRAEVPGQQQINVYHVVLDAELPDVDLFSRVHWRDAWWDVVTPPGYHHGTRATRHWSMDIRQRPEAG